jgi:hypothetical protein
MIVQVIPSEFANVYYVLSTLPGKIQKEIVNHMNSCVEATILSLVLVS